jgi:hypothetical protein
VFRQRTVVNQGVKKDKYGRWLVVHGGTELSVNAQLALWHAVAYFGGEAPV